MQLNLHPHPQPLKSIVATSRETGILLPATSYIVVENSAQWKMLQMKEKQKLGSLEALEFMETPEPGFWILLAGLLLFGRRQSLVQLFRRA